MKKAAALFLALSLTCLFCVSGAEGTVLQFRRDGFEAALPGENWVEGFSDDISTYYYGNPLCSMDDGMIMIMIEREDSLAGVTLTDEYYDMLYNALLQDAAASSAEGTVTFLYSDMAGIRSVVYWCRQDIDGSGVIYSLAASMAVIDAQLFAIMIVHPSMDPEDLKDLALEMGSTVRYEGFGESGLQESTVSAVSLEDLPPKDNPFVFEPSITNQQDLLFAQWMMDEATRALCTMTLTMDMELNQGTFGSSSHPMDVFQSYIGSAEDTILTFIPSQDGTLAYIFEYDTANQTALYYGVALTDEALAAFEASCEDQFYANTEDGLVYAVGLIQEAFGSLE